MEKRPYGSAKKGGQRSVPPPHPEPLSGLSNFLRCSAEQHGEYDPDALRQAIRISASTAVSSPLDGLRRLRDLAKVGAGMADRAVINLQGQQLRADRQSPRSPPTPDQT